MSDRSWGSAVLVQEARYKRGVCLLEMGRLEDAAGVFEALTPEEGDVWPLVAACRLWLTRVEQGRVAEGDAVIDILDARGASRQLASLIPRDLSLRITNRITPGVRGIATHDPQREQQLRRLHRAYTVFGLPFSNRSFSGIALAREVALGGNPDEAVRILMPIADPDNPDARGFGQIAFVNYCWMENVCGPPERALQLIDRFHAARSPDDIGGTGLALWLERCYAHAKLGDWAACDDDLDAFMAEFDRFNERSRGTNRYLFFQEYAMACAARGFLREREGNRAAAEREWSKGNYERLSREATGLAPAPLEQGAPGFPLVMRSMLAALAGELSDEEAQRIIADTLAVASQGSPLQIAGAGAVPLRPALLREMWRTPRGREVARRYATGGTCGAAGGSGSTRP